MARSCICKICKAKLTTDVAFKIQRTDKNGKNVNLYYCDSIEYEMFQEEKNCKEDILTLINSILGYTCVNSSVYKELETVHKGYSYKEILNCMTIQQDIILNLFRINGIDKEFNRIRYMFAVISRAIEDNTKDLKRKLADKLINKVAVEDIKEEEEYVPFSDYSFTETKTTDFSNFF